MATRKDKRPRSIARSKKGGNGKAVRKPWTVLVWIAGDNDLDSFGLKDLHEMKKVGSNDRLNIVAQFDRAGAGVTTRRYFLRKGTTLQADVVASLGETNTGDPAVAADFLAWGMKNYPSDKTMVVIWNHGSGIDEEDVYRRARREGLRVYRRDGAGDLPRRRVTRIASSRFRRSLFSTTVSRALNTRAIAYDDTNRDFLDNAELKKVLARAAAAAGRRIDVFGMDACLMNMLEVAYQLRDTVAYIVASEELEPGDGWPYHTVLADLAAAPNAATAKVVQKITARYLASYTASDGVTCSALDISQVNSVARAVDALAGACLAVLGDTAEWAALAKALKVVQRFDTKDFIDLGDFVTQLAARSGDAGVKAACQSVLAALTGGAKPFVIAEGHKGQHLARATGTAIYFPTAGDAEIAYDKLDFAKATRWDELLTQFQGA